MEAYHFIGPVLAALTALSLGGMALIGVRMWSRRPRHLTEEDMAAMRGRLGEDIREEVTRALCDRDDHDVSRYRSLIFDLYPITAAIVSFRHEFRKTKGRSGIQGSEQSLRAA